MKTQPAEQLHGWESNRRSFNITHENTQISLISKFRIYISLVILLMTNEKLTKGFELVLYCQQQCGGSSTVTTVQRKKKLKMQKMIRELSLKVEYFQTNCE